MYVSFGVTSNGNSVKIGGLPYAANGTSSNYSLLTAHTNGSIADFALRAQGGTTTLTGIYRANNDGDSKPNYSQFSNKFIIMGGTYRSST